MEKARNGKGGKIGCSKKRKMAGNIVTQTRQPWKQRDNFFFISQYKLKERGKGAAKRYRTEVTGKYLQKQIAKANNGISL